MLPFKRSQRVSNLIRKEASDIIMNRLKDPRLGFVTVTNVVVSDDLKTASIYYSVFNEDEIKDTGDGEWHSPRNYPAGDSGTGF